jgi:hypothetical protein
LGFGIFCSEEKRRIRQINLKTGQIIWVKARRVRLNCTTVWAMLALPSGRELQVLCLLKNRGELRFTGQLPSPKHATWEGKSPHVRPESPVFG